MIIRHILQAIQIVAALGTVASVGYYLLCLWSAELFLSHEHRAEHAGEGARATPPVSILKPLRGTDPEMYESFRSQCRQDYPEYEIIFGVSDADDPAAAAVERLKQEFPDRAIVLTICPENLGANAKVSNLIQMSRQARSEYFVVSDSDIRVEPDYLRRVVAPLGDPKVGLVTCLYRGVASRTIGSRLESLSISADFVPGVLAARTLESGIYFGLGSTLAFRRRDLEAVGSFEAFADYLADDYELGKRIANRGLKVELSDVVVETFLPAYSFAEFIGHQLRWSRTIRDARRGGYVGLAFTFGLFWSLVALLASRGAGWAWTLLGVTVCVRLIMAITIGKNVLQDTQVPRSLWLIPARDLLGVAVWAGGLLGNTILWRGKKFALKNGRLANET